MNIIDINEYKKEKTKNIKKFDYSFLNTSCAEDFENEFSFTSVSLERDGLKCSFTIYNDDLNIIDMIVLNLCTYFEVGFKSGSKLKSV